MRRASPLSFLLIPLLLTGCAGSARFGAVEPLELDSVVLYRNGVGYFERRGEVQGDTLRLRVRKDQVNDLLKSLTVVDRDGKAVSVSMPLDPRTWANAALAVLAPGRGSLAQVLDALRGTEVTLFTGGQGAVRGRIVMVERVINEPDPKAPRTGGVAPAPLPDQRDWKVTVLQGDSMRVVRLSKVTGIRLQDGDLAMQIHRSLDASAGEGMFEQVEVELRLVGARTHDLTVSYVVAAPMWKPTYRVVLPADGKGDALLQGWAVVDNTSGEDWSNVSLSLTSGAPIAFRYDLHTPRDVPRTDLTESGVRKRARVAIGETSYGEEEPEEEELLEEERKEAEKGRYSREKSKRDRGVYDFEDDAIGDSIGGLGLSGTGRGGGGAASGYGRGIGAPASGSTATRPAPAAPPPAEPSGPSLDPNALQRSAQASARSKQVTGLTRLDLTNRVSLPDGTSTMVAILNETVSAEQTFLFKPGGGGMGYERNPYRVVRFENTTQNVLEPGPISIYSGGSFVGEGLSEAVGAGTSVTIPFAVESGVLVESTARHRSDEMKIARLVGGVLEVMTYYQTTTKWTAKTQPSVTQGKDVPVKVLIRHPRSGANYELAKRPEGTEDLAGAYLVPLVVPAGKRSASIELVEQSPSRTSIQIWDGRALKLLEALLATNDLDAAGRKQLQPIIDARREIGRIDTEIEGLKKQQRELDHRANETRKNLEAIKKDPKAGALRKKLNGRLDEFTKKGDALGRKVVELSSKRLEKKIELEDQLEGLDLRTAVDRKSDAKGKK